MDDIIKKYAIAFILHIFIQIRFWGPVVTAGNRKALNK